MASLRQIKTNIHIECTVIGAGVVGISIARALARQGREVVLIEKQKSFGMETSSRNSEVIHAGIYYRPQSLKAQLCVKGRKLLYNYCESRNVPHKRIGKVIVAVNDNEISMLEHYIDNAVSNGVYSLEWLDRSEINAIEPNIQGVCALWSPDTGIVDSHKFMQSLLDDFEAAGGLFIRRTQVVGGEVSPSGKRLFIRDEEESVISTDILINAAGLDATLIADFLHKDAMHFDIPKTHFAIGHYYTLKGPSPFTHLVYPVAQPGGLGVHVTLDLAGTARFGPDVRWIKEIDYHFSDEKRPDFIRAIQRYCPSIQAADIEPGYTGIRPKIGGPAQPDMDFQIVTEKTHGIPQLIHLFGIESPGLTASLALAETIANEFIQ